MFGFELLLFTLMLRLMQFLFRRIGARFGVSDVSSVACVAANAVEVRRMADNAIIVFFIILFPH